MFFVSGNPGNAAATRVPAGQDYEEYTNDALFIPIYSPCYFLANSLNGNTLQKKIILKLFPVIFQSYPTMSPWSSCHPVKNAQYSRVLPTFFFIDHTSA